MSAPDDDAFRDALKHAGAKIVTAEAVRACVAAFWGTATPEQLKLLARATRDSCAKKNKFTPTELEAAQRAIFAALPDALQPSASSVETASKIHNHEGTITLGEDDDDIDLLLAEAEAQASPNVEARAPQLWSQSAGHDSAEEDDDVDLLLAEAEALATPNVEARATQGTASGSAEAGAADAIDSFTAAWPPTLSLPSQSPTQPQYTSTPRSPSSQLRRRQIPGPAGLSSQERGREISAPGAKFFRASVNSGAWAAMRADLQLNDDDPACLMNQFTIAWAKRRDCPGIAKRLPFLACVIAEVDNRHKDPKVLLTDPTGTMSGMIDRNLIDDHGDALIAGSLVVLKNVHVMMNETEHFLLISAEMLCRIYKSDLQPAATFAVVNILPLCKESLNKAAEDYLASVKRLIARRQGSAVLSGTTGRSSRFVEEAPSPGLTMGHNCNGPEQGQGDMEEDEELEGYMSSLDESVFSIG